jgi:hypothetical protein
VSLNFLLEGGNFSRQLLMQGAQALIFQGEAAYLLTGRLQLFGHLLMYPERHCPRPRLSFQGLGRGKAVVAARSYREAGSPKVVLHKTYTGKSGSSKGSAKRRLPPPA